jgi:hypothetical protein
MALDDHRTVNDLLWSKLHDKPLEATRPAAVQQLVQNIRLISRLVCIKR